MAARGYCTIDDVASWLGVTLSAEQAEQGDRLIEAAEVEMDGLMNRGFLLGTVTNERHEARFQVWLRNLPVTSITAVAGRVIDDPNEVWETIAPADYELISGVNGLMTVAGTWAYEVLRVTYVQTAVVPADLRQACAELVASKLQTTLNPALYGVDAVTLPDYSVKYNRAMTGAGGMPPNVAMVCERYRMWAGAG